MKILNQTQGVIIATDVKVADTFLSRMVGLLNHAELKEGEGLKITHCQSIHMFFMRFPIDVVFVDKSNCVVGLVRDIQPFKLSPMFFKASYAIELKAGVIAKTRTSVGDLLIPLQD